MFFHCNRVIHTMNWNKLAFLIPVLGWFMVYTSKRSRWFSSNIHWSYRNWDLSVFANHSFTINNLWDVHILNEDRINYPTFGFPRTISYTFKNYCQKSGMHCDSLAGAAEFCPKKINPWFHRDFRNWSGMPAPFFKSGWWFKPLWKISVSWDNDDSQCMEK